MSWKSEGKRRLAVVLGLAGIVGAAGPAVAQQAGSAAVAPRTIRVAGVGEAQARPDAARLTFAVETFAATANEAAQENAGVMERVVAALVAAGVPRSDIETSNFTVFPEYAQEPQPDRAAERIRGYRATNQVALRTGRLERVGELIDVALAAGANRVDGVAFELRDADAVQAEATRRAVERARVSARTIAAALGVELGEVLEASTVVEPVRPMPYAMERAGMMARDAAANTPIEPGDQTVLANVTLVFEIR